jgi:hypothetical protein
VRTIAAPMRCAPPVTSAVRVNEESADMPAF